MAAPPRHVILDPDGTWLPKWLVVVVRAATGVVYHQQCCGVVCDQRRVQGFLVPLGGLKLGADAGMIDPAEFEAVFHEGEACVWGAANNALPAARLAQLRQLVLSVPYWTAGSDGETEACRGIELDDSRLEQLTEAWVPVLTPDGPGILMWSNCD
ncbi:MAG: hypothetical protein HOW73_24200 [Polyangiaceae bacterium]|nr:hypothetical protein [Polyangiaceae bacterium]